MDYRQLVRALAAGRVVVGASALLVPSIAGKGWIGETGAHREVGVIVRAFGARDLALGIGTLQVLDSDDSPRPWVTAGILCDAVDLAATALAVRRLGLRRALPVMVVAGGATVAGYLARDQVD